MGKKTANYISTTNACKLCKPLGACLASKGIEGMVAYLHGSQGCATYMRRYIISHYHEPIDIASSSLSEKHAIYGGGPNLKIGLSNVREKYRPELIGIATTCLTETIGDNVPMFIDQYIREQDESETQKLPEFVDVSTPSYDGTHMEGFHGAVVQVIRQLTETPADKKNNKPVTTLNLLPGFVSSADYRLLKEIMADFELDYTMLPDLSETMDGPALLEYEKVPAGGTPLQKIKNMSRAGAVTVEFGRTVQDKYSGGVYLEKEFGVENKKLGLPLGIEESDRFFASLAELSGRDIPKKYQGERGRLVDAYVDGHKYIFDKKAIVYGEEDLVVGMTAFLAEIGVRPVLCASGGTSGNLAGSVAEVSGHLLPEPPIVHEGMDFFDISEMAESLQPDLLIGHSKGYQLARKLDIPLIRVGFPVHDRVGGQRILHLGYRGAQLLFDRITNAVIAKKQADSGVGYSYM